MAISTIDNNGVNLGQLGNRNLIINGAMQVAQRSTSATANGYVSLDRWLFNTSGGTGTFRHYAEILRQVEAGTLTIADAE